MWIAVFFSLAVGFWAPSDARAGTPADSGPGAALDTAFSQQPFDLRFKRIPEWLFTGIPSGTSGVPGAAASTVAIEYKGSALWSTLRDVAVQGDYAYCSMIEGLAVLDVSDPTLPVRVGQLFLPNSGKRQLVVRGDFIYLAGGYGGLQIIDISDPTQPTLVAERDTPDWARDLELVGDYAYVCDFSRLLIFDVSDPKAPFQVAQAGPVISRAYTASAHGDYLYVAGGPNGFHVVDISDPTAPILVQTIKQFEFTEILEVSGDTLYVQNNTNNIFMWDITDPNLPLYLGSRAVPTVAYEMKVLDGFYYGVAEKWFAVADVFNPPVFPEKDMVWDSLTDGLGFELVDTLIYASDAATGLEILTLHDPDSTPQRVGSYITPDYSDRIALSGHYALVRDYRDYPPFRWGLNIVDVSNPATPVHVGTYMAPGKIYDAEWNDTLVYVADNNAGLQVLNIGDSGTPTVVHEENSLFAYDLAVVDSILYVANTQGLQVFDIQAPTSPALLGTANGFGAATVVKVSGDYAFLSTATTGFQIVDVSNPVAPIPLGSVPATGITDIGISGDIACAVNVANLLVFDCSDKAAPFQLASHNTRAKTYGIEVRGAYAYVADGSLTWVDESGLWLYDITNPALPSVAGFFHTPGVIWDIALSGPNVFVADFNGFLSLSVDLGTGDVNDDGKLTGADLVWLVNYLYKDGPDPLPNLYEGDVNCDGKVDLIDLIYLGNHIFRAGLPPC